MPLLTRDFVTKRTTTLLKVPQEWGVQAGLYYYYQLGLRMCQIRFLKYEFAWGNESQPVPKASPVTEQPSRILVLDLSLNDLMTLDHTGLTPFKQLRVLDASLNRINSIAGLQVLRFLYSVNLSHNKIDDIEGLFNCHELVDLNLGMNEIHSISQMPYLPSLRVLHINNNKLRSLEGIQILSGLQELYVQRNQLSDLIPLSSCIQLAVVNASDNAIMSLNTTVEVLRGLHKLHSVCLYGNPIDREGNYQSALSRGLNIRYLDNVSLEPRSTSQDRLGDTPLNGLKDIVHAAFADHLKLVRARMEDNVSHKQRQIILLQKEYQQYEEMMMRDLHACVQFLDRIPAHQVAHYNYDFLTERLNTPGPRPWHERPSPVRENPKLGQHQKQPANPQFLPGPHRKQRPDYSNVKETDDVLRCAYNELIRQDAGLHTSS